LQEPEEKKSVNQITRILKVKNHTAQAKTYTEKEKCQRKEKARDSVKSFRNFFVIV